MRLRLKSHNQSYFNSFVWEEELLKEQKPDTAYKDTEYALLTLYRNK